jgi:hypothetical protein
MDWGLSQGKSELDSVVRGGVDAAPLPLLQVQDSDGAQGPYGREQRALRVAQETLAPTHGVQQPPEAP